MTPHAALAATGLNRTVQNVVPRLLLGLGKLYNRYSALPRGHVACSRLIGWGVRHLGFNLPLLRLKSGMVFEYSPSIAGDVLVLDLIRADCFEPDQTEIIRASLPQGGVFIDVGANIGYFSIVAAKCVGPTGLVYAFEPVEDIYRVLCRNVRLNELHNVRPENLACFSSPGVMAMERTQDSGKSHLSDADSQNARPVRVTTVDEYIAHAGVGRIDFIKIDAEGSDFEVLQGARRTVERFRPAIMLEVDHLSRFGGSHADVAAFCDAYAYTLTPIQGKYSTDVLCRPSK